MVHPDVAALKLQHNPQDKAAGKIEALQSLLKSRDIVSQKLAFETRLLEEVLLGKGESDPLAAANSEHERLLREIEKIEPLDGARDDALQVHGAGADRLRAMERYLEALDRESRRVDVRTLVAWKPFQDGLNETAGLIVDCEALASIIRSRQKQLSDQRLAAVNTNLDKYFSMITGEENARARGLRVVAHETPKRMTYSLVDDSGGNLIPILNQGDLNAVSIAMLFAQVENQGGQGGLALVVLDDPEQSLDEKHVNGLAEAIQQIATHCSVLVGAPPGSLERRVKGFVSCPKRFISLNDWDPDAGATVGPLDDGS